MNQRTKDVNPRVYDIWRQAASTVSPLKTGGDWQKDFVKKFAELIIRECANVVKEFYQEDEFTCYSAAEEIKTHFGVEV